MTSIIIDTFLKQQRAVHRDLNDSTCAFCQIVAGEMPAFKVYEDEHVLAFLDILPIRRGHTLLIPKHHYSRMTHLPAELSAHLARALPKLCRAVGKGTGQEDFNLVSNNGYAQVVDHVHWHIVPAPDFSGRNTKRASQAIDGAPTAGVLGYRELARRNELDDNEGEELAASIRIALEEENAQSEPKVKL